MRAIVAIVLSLVASAAPAAAQLPPAAPVLAPTPSPAPDYTKIASWLCRPGHADACNADQTATIVAPDGSMRKEAWAPAKAPAIDCFYIYPTVSLDKSRNSDMTPGVEEPGAASQQFDRLGSQCRVYVPLYRQVTITELFTTPAGSAVSAADNDLAYRDVRAAWQEYLRSDNKGRGFVLVGHSQGSRMVKRLMMEEIDGKPVQRQLVGAYVGGVNLLVPNGKIVGGDLKSIPLCTAAGERGCVVSWVSFRSDVPPPANSRFGRTDVAGMQIACVNAAAFSQRAAVLDSYLAAGPNSLSAQPVPAWTSKGTVSTPFVKVPGLLTGQCVDRDGAHYLEVTTRPDPADARTDSIVGDLVISGKVQAEWGLHLIDMNLMMGDIVRNIALQAKAPVPAAR